MGPAGQALGVIGKFSMLTIIRTDVTLNVTLRKGSEKCGSTTTRVTSWSPGRNSRSRDRLRALA